MRFNSFTMKGPYKSHSSGGSSVRYTRGDVVEINSNYYICDANYTLSSPLTVASDWIRLSESQVAFSTENEPFFTKPGDEWFNTSTGKNYKRVSDNNGDHWVEI